MVVKNFLVKLRKNSIKYKVAKEKFSILFNRLDAIDERLEDLVIASNTHDQNRRDIRNIGNSNNKIRIAFIVQHVSIWPSWYSVWKACMDNKNVVVDVILAPYFHVNASTSISYDDMHKLLLDEDISFYSAEYYNLNNFMPHVVFLQNPYEESRPQQFQYSEFIKRNIKIAYIPYGLEMGGGSWNIESQFNMPVHQNAWRVFARSNRHKKMFSKYCHAGSGHVVVTGHPKFDVHRKSSGLCLNAQLKRKINGRKVLLWTPHFGVGLPPTWSTFRIYCDSIIEIMRQQTELFLLIRPHPLFFQAMKNHNVWNAEDEAQFIRMIKESDNFALDVSGDPQNSFHLADALMSDVGSFLLEFLITEKPILYLHHPEGLGMNDDEDLIDYLYSATSVDQIEMYIQMIANGEDAKKSKRLSAIDEFLFGLDKNIGVRISDHIVSALRAGDDSSPSFQSNHDQQVKSDTYWVNAKTTYLAPKEYYDKREEILKRTMQDLPHLDNIIDIGCGDGRFTNLFARFAKNVSAYDISPILIDQAIATAKEEGINNVEFAALEVDAIKPFSKFSMVVCMGVTSCMIDDVKFIRILEKFKSLVKPGGYLLMIDTLSTSLEQSASDGNGYLAKYRSINDYCELISRRNFELEQEILIKDILDRELVNKLFIFSNNN